MMVGDKSSTFGDYLLKYIDNAAHQQLEERKITGKPGLKTQVLRRKIGSA
jgi:hypothetical protein